MRSFLKRLSKSSIQSRILISFCVLLTISFATSSALSFTLVRRYAQETEINHSEQILFLMTQNINRVIDSIENTARQVVLNDKVVEYCENTGCMSEYERAMWENSFAQNLMTGILRSNTQISSILLYSREGYCFSFGESQKMATENYQSQELFQKGMEAKGVCWFNARHIGEQDSQGYDVISMTWPVEASDSWDITGLLEIQIPVEQMTSSLESSNVEDGSGVLLLDEGGNSLVLPQTEFQNTEGIFSALQEQKHLEKQSTSLEIEGKEYLFNYNELKNGWMLVYYQPMKNLSHISDEGVITYFLSAICLLFVMVFISKRVSGQLIHPIHEVIDITSNMEQEVEMQSDQKEIAALFNNYNLMMQRIRESELDTLRAQITPHFLYNTLNSIKCRALLDRNKDVAQMLQWLINLLELSINNHSEYLTLDGEIEMLQSYIGLQRMRSGRTFTLSVEIMPVNLGSCLIPKMILQTLAENAIMHGFEEKEESGTILVRATGQERDLVIEVIDDGNGMSEESIREVLSGQQEEVRGRLNRVGIYNVNQRIKLYFGKKYGLSIESVLGEGTRVIIRMPCVRDPELFHKGVRGK